MQRYDLKKMLEEIRAEEGAGKDQPSRKLSQDEIKALLLKKKTASPAVNP